MRLLLVAAVACSAPAKPTTPVAPTNATAPSPAGADPKIVIRLDPPPAVVPSLDEVITRRLATRQRARMICACLDIQGHAVVQLTIASNHITSVQLNGLDVVTSCVQHAIAQPLAPSPPAADESLPPGSITVSYPFHTDSFARWDDEACREGLQRKSSDRDFR